MQAEPLHTLLDMQASQLYAWYAKTLALVAVKFDRQGERLSLMGGVRLEAGAYLFSSVFMQQLQLQFWQ